MQGGDEKRKKDERRKKEGGEDGKKKEEEGGGRKRGTNVYTGKERGEEGRGVQMYTQVRRGRRRERKKKEKGGGGGGGRGRRIKEEIPRSNYITKNTAFCVQDTRNMLQDHSRHVPAACSGVCSYHNSSIILHCHYGGLVWLEGGEEQGLKELHSYLWQTSYCIQVSLAS